MLARILKPTESKMTVRMVWVTDAVEVIDFLQYPFHCTVFA